MDTSDGVKDTREGLALGSHEDMTVGPQDGLLEGDKLRVDGSTDTIAIGVVGTIVGDAGRSVVGQSL